MAKTAKKENLPAQINKLDHPADIPGAKGIVSAPVEVLSNESFEAPDKNLDRKIERWKRELLDTGKRNKMINYRETKRSTLQILEPGASELFNKLAFSEKPLSFQKPISKDSDLRLYSIIALMETLAYNLNVQQGDIKTSGTIIEREKTLKNLRSKAKLAQEEQGTNILYLCFGFIYWRENNRDNSPWCKAPLLMMPVTLGLKSLNAPYTLSRDDDEIEVNPTLDYLFSTEYNIDLPSFELRNRDSFDEYLTQIEELVDKRGWKVMPEVSLGLLSFLKISMYHDLNNNRDRMQASPVLRAMAGDRAAIDDLPAEAENFNFDEVDPKKWHEVVDSDSSQEEAILLSKLGVNFVMQGPPGTGKSQTITNIIAEAMADGKKVLFVSEKAAALQVVLKRLTEVHLDDFCLSLHNYKANKKEIVDSIGANLSLTQGYIDYSVYNDLTELFHDRQFLDEYAEQLHRIIPPLDQSVYMVFGKLSKLEQATQIDFHVDDISGITRDNYSSLLYCVLAFEKALQNLGGTLTANPWYGTKAVSSGQTYKNQLEAETSDLSGELRKIASLATDIDSSIGVGAVNTYRGAEKLLKVARILQNKPAYINRKWLNKEAQRSTHALLKDAKCHAEVLRHYQQSVADTWRDGVYAIDVNQIRENFCGDYSWIYDTTNNTPIEQRLEQERCAANELLQQLEGILTIYRNALEMLAYDQRDTIENIKMVSEVLGLAAEAPYMEASWFDARKMKKVLPLVEEACQHNRNISTMINEVLSQWEPGSLEIEVDSFLSRFKTQYNGQFFNAYEDYAKDIKALRLYNKKAVDSIDSQTIGGLQKIKRIQSEAAWFHERKNTRIVLLADEAMRRSKAIADKIEVVLKDWEPTVFEIDAGSMLSRFKTDYLGIFHKLKEQYKEDIKTLRLHFKAVGIKIDEPVVVETLQQIKEIQSEAAWFGAGKSAEIVSVTMEAVQRSLNLSAMVQEILEDWEPTILETEIDEMLSRFKAEYSGTFHKIKKAYEDDFTSLCLFLKPGNTEVNVTSAMRLFLNIKEIQTEKNWFDINRDALVAAIGSKYRGVETDWDQVCDGMATALAITSKFPYGNISEATIAALLKITESLQLSGTARKHVEGLSDAVLDHMAERISECKFINRFTSKSMIGRNVIPQIKAFMENCIAQSQHIVSFSSEKREGPLTYEDITALLDNFEKVRSEQNWFEGKATACRDLFGELNHGADSPWEELNAGLVCAEQISQAFEGNIPDEVIGLLCGSEMIHEGVDELAALMDSVGPKIETFEAQFEGCNLSFFDMDMSQVADRYDACMDGFSDLNKWLDYVETRAACDKQGLADFTSVIAGKDNSIVDVKDAFERGFYTQWLTMQLDAVPAVQSFRRRVHEQRSERFATLDTKQYEIARNRIRESIISTYPSINSVAKAGSELGILRHEMEKKRRIMPVRKLFQKIPNLLLTLKPCLMMSPLSVAYFLDAGSYQFDMVIFDEASQIFPQDAIGAIFRAKQVVIAGDTRQLPPTNFFSSSTSNANDTYDEDEEIEEEVYDSILEETANILPNRTLLWHYRSKHEHLIAFSNQEIYKNELVTFPSSNESEPDTGVEFVYVQDGYYEGGGKNCNVLEAKRCVQLVKEHIDRHPERSLGIIAFSEKQQQAILLEIQRFREHNPKYEDFFREGKEDEFFVKNLENVQGDERDTILFSIGYARTKEQKANGRAMSMRFGPLGVAGGERRLNVAITRAKINIKLVSSILPSDIDLSKTESEGIRMLRSYIEFAMNGETTLAAAHRNGAPDDFVDVILKYVQDHGYKMKQYVGCSGYKIDIAIQHPSNTIEQFAAGIECDGFSYASARTARDRDRLRGSVLKNMGWNLYRVWSAEWYKNPEIEGKRLLEFIDTAIMTCDEKVKRLEEEKRKAEERRAEEAKAEAAREAEEKERQRELEVRVSATRRNEALAGFRARRIGAVAKVPPGPNTQSAVAPEEQAEPLNLEWVKENVRVHHSVFGDGKIESISGRHVTVLFDDAAEKTFILPDAFVNGHLTKKEVAVKREMPENHGSVRLASPMAQLDSIKKAESQPGAGQNPKGLLGVLQINRFKYIDNRATSSILWVLYEPGREGEFEQLIAGYDVQWRFEKRGALATGNAPAWRVMFH